MRVLDVWGLGEFERDSELDVDDGGVSRVIGVDSVEERKIGCSSGGLGEVMAAMDAIRTHHWYPGLV